MSDADLGLVEERVEVNGGEALTDGGEYLFQRGRVEKAAGGVGVEFRRKKSMKYTLLGPHLHSA
jgi:hypothetical protein